MSQFSTFAAPLTGQTLPASLQAIADLVPTIAATAAITEEQRALPEALVEALKKAGAFRALIPVCYDGLEAPYEDYIALIQSLAKADASTAWCVNQGAVIALTSLWLPEPNIQQIWQDPDAAVANGPPFDCEISPTDGGYRLRGHWGFSSGCQHATWMNGAARCTTGGWRVAYFLPEQVTFTDNWQVPGLRGTGSFEFRVDNLDLDAAWVANQAEPATYSADVTTVPLALLFGCSFAALALGVAAGALEDVLEIARGKLPRYASLHLRDDPDVQRFLGQATARWHSANTYLHTTVAEVLESVRQNGVIEHDQRAALRLSSTHVIRECAAVVELAYKVSGSTGIYQNETLQRRFQDMHVITQHVQAREAYFALLGRYAISGEYELGPMT